MNALRVAHYFEMVILTGVWGRAFSKPHLRAFQLVQSTLNPPDGRFIYVADNPEKDFVAPAALGWQTVRVRRPEGLHAERDAQPGMGADIEVSDLWGLYDLVYRKKRGVIVDVTRENCEHGGSLADFAAQRSAKGRHFRTPRRQKPS